MGAPDTAMLAPKAEADAILKAGEAIEKHRNTPKRSELLHSVPYVILRDKDGAERAEYLRDQVINPTFRKGTVKLDDSASFIAYFQDHSTAVSTIYAKIDPCKFVAVMDEHPKAQATPPSWRHFRAEFIPLLSKEWLTWNGHNGSAKPFTSTEEFAYFIEDNAPDVIQPSAAEMMEVALNFKVNQEVSYKAAQRLQDGHLDLQYQNIVNGSAVSGGGSVKIPETFRISIPVFAGISARTYEIDARFRYRLASGALKLWYELVRPHKTLERAFEDLWNEVGEKTGRTILLGAAE